MSSLKMGNNIGNKKDSTRTQVNWTNLLFEFIYKRLDVTDKFATDLLYYLYSEKATPEKIKNDFGENEFLVKKYLDLFLKASLIDRDTLRVSSVGKKILHFIGLKDDYPLNPNLEPFRGIIAEKIIKNIAKKQELPFSIDHITNYGLSQNQIEEALLDLAHQRTLVALLKEKNEINVLNYDINKLKTSALYYKSLVNLEHLHILVITEKYNENAGNPVETLGTLQNLITSARKEESSHFHVRKGKKKLHPFQPSHYFPCSFSLVESGLETLYLTSFRLTSCHHDWYTEGFSANSRIDLGITNQGRQITTKVYEKAEDYPLMHWIAYSAENSVSEFLGV